MPLLELGQGDLCWRANLNATGEKSKGGHKRAGVGVGRLRPGTGLISKRQGDGQRPAACDSTGKGDARGP